MFTLQEVTTQQVWEEAIAFFPEANFLQAWEWGEFHTALKKKVTRYAIYEEETTVGLFQIVIEKAKRGSYFGIAGGPLLDWSNREVVSFWLDQVRHLAKTEKVVFVRFRPQAQSSPELLAFVHAQGAVLAPMHLTADLTLQLDCTQSESELLAQMRKNTRYEIRKADTLGISTTVCQDPAEIQRFYAIQCEVAKKHHFVPFSYDFFQEQFNAFVKNDKVVLISAYQAETLLAQAFIIFDNKEAVYHYGVSTAENSKLPGSYACQWQAIKEAKARGCTRYNFWGIAPEEQKEHRFAGVSLFKRGFGGKEIEYLPAHDLPVSLAYWLTYWFERIRKWQRRL